MTDTVKIVDKAAPGLETVDAGARESITRLACDLVNLAMAVKRINAYDKRLIDVDQICTAILAPDPILVAANESYAQLAAAWASGKMGTLVAITAEWDEKWQFVFNVRGTGGYQILDGFDLRPETPGLRSFLDVLDKILKIDVALVDISAPKAANANSLDRRLVYPKAR